ncbi:class I SAM-dependent methyltransferase [Microbacterium sp. 2216-1]|uniref:class I SAM-dependent methyltransferase n=1 Tax=Microbacterium sp. 2216-1 TaxID=3390053 RepID=UPI003976EF29
MIDEWRRAYEESTMVGWDFSTLDGQLIADEPWWDFERDCRSAMVRARQIVDLGTGGGERLLDLVGTDGIAGKSIIATEGWESNVAVAQQALAPRGITVVRYDSEHDARMPLADSSLDLVMSRHESIDPQEISRVLAPGGRLLTQQVDGRDAEEIHEWFDEPFEYPHVTSRRFVNDIEAAGLRVDVVDDWHGTMEFENVTALITYLALTPWDAPNFSVSDHEAKLVALDEDRPIKVTQRRFRVYATKA